MMDFSEAVFLIGFHFVQAAVIDLDQVVGRHHHPNAYLYLSAVLYLSGSGSGEEGVLHIHAPTQSNELVTGSAVGHGGPIAAGHPLNQPHWDLAPQAGLLVLFPSRLEHSVLANGCPELLRCSISFDFVQTAPVDEDPPEYLARHPSTWRTMSSKII